MIPHPAPDAPSCRQATVHQRVVLDTNVLLDLFVFDDPRWASLLAKMKAGSVQAITREDCKSEWRIVLTYPQLPLDDDRRSVCHAHYESLVACHEFAPVPGIHLPRCSDGDDQKFLELARDGKADVLITKDKALLKLARKTAQAGLFQILTPQSWVARHG